MNRIGGFLTDRQVEAVHQGALRVLSEGGLRVEQATLLERLEALGALVEGNRARFPRDVVEERIGEATGRRAGASPAGTTRPDESISGHPPTIGAYSGIYQSAWLDPDTGETSPFDESRLAFYIALARSLPCIERVGLLGLPFLPDGMAPRCLPLAEKLYGWKYGASPDGSVQFTDLCAPLLEMFQCHAAYHGVSIDNVFTAAGYLISPLRLARPECEQLLYFHERGLRMGIGHLPSQGGSAPVTLAGTLVLTLAEQFALFLVRRSLWDDARLSISAAASPLDMRTATLCYGRPEQARQTLAFADIARRYGLNSGGHAGLTDAKMPSTEAGVQKATGAVVSALATGHGTVEAGLLGIDEICSPVQMILDHDLADSLRAIFAAPKFFEAGITDGTESMTDDIERAVEEIVTAGPGGSHIGTEMTARRFRRELFVPRTWSYRSLSGWVASGRRTDVDAALEVLHDFRSGYRPVSWISDEEESDLRKIIAAASAAAR